MSLTFCMLIHQTSLWYEFAVCLGNNNLLDSLKNPQTGFKRAFMGKYKVMFYYKNKFSRANTSLEGGGKEQTCNEYDEKR